MVNVGTYMMDPVGKGVGAHCTLGSLIQKPRYT